MTTLPMPWRTTRPLCPSTYHVIGLSPPAATLCRTLPHPPTPRVYLPVFVEGANLSMGDMHFSQGDGEVSFCGAIEMSGWLELRWVGAGGGGWKARG